MGMYGGVKRVVRFQCTTCDELYEKHDDAMVCCDDRVARAQETKRRKTAERMMRNVRVRVTRERTPGGQFMMVGRAYHKSLHRPAEVKVYYGFSSWARLTAEDAKKKARNLALAQATRSIKCRISY